MKKVEKIWAQLSKAKKGTKLGKQVKLSLVDDAQKQYEYLEEVYSDVSYFAYEEIERMEDKLQEIVMDLDNWLVNSSMSSIYDARETLKESLDKIEKSAEALGIDPDEIFPDFQDASEMILATDSSIDDAKSEWKGSRLSRISNFDLPL